MTNKSYIDLGIEFNNDAGALQGISYYLDYLILSGSIYSSSSSSDKSSSSSSHSSGSSSSSSQSSSSSKSSSSSSKSSSSSSKSSSSSLSSSKSSSSSSFKSSSSSSFKSSSSSSRSSSSSLSDIFASSVTYTCCDGITTFVWTFDTDYQVGQYITGDWWVLDPGEGVTINSVSPAPSGSGSTYRNGSQINPYSRGTTNYNTAYDGRVSAFQSGYCVTYPIVPALTAGQSLVSTIASPEADADTDVYGAAVQANERGPKWAAILTCVASEPSATAFRPAYAGSTKTQYDAASIVWQNLVALSQTTNPPASQLADVLQMVHDPWLDEINDWPCERIHNYGQMPHYGREIGLVAGECGVLVCCNYTQTQKTQLVYAMIQKGIDFYAISQNTRNWRGDHGGYHNGRKFFIVFAGYMLDNASLRDIGTTVQFGEDDQTYYGTEESGNVGQDYVAFWGCDVSKDAPPNFYTQGCTGSGEKTLQATDDDGVLLNLDGCPDYRGSQTSWSWPGQMIAILAMGLKDEWGHDAWFDYVDRWMSYGADDPVDLGSLTTYSSPAYVPAFWNEFRGSYTENPSAENPSALTPSSSSSSKSSSSSSNKSSSSSSSKSSSSSSSKSSSSSSSKSSSSSSSLSVYSVTFPTEILYGKDDGSQGETEINWSGWLNSDGSPVTLSGGSYGEIYISPLGVISPVIFSLDTFPVTYYTNLTRYTNTFSPTIYFRSSNSPFSQLDALPSYSLYTSPISTSNQYTQIKLTRSII